MVPDARLKADSRIPRRGDAADEAVAPVSARKLAAAAPECDRLGFEFCSSLPIPKFATEEATKWDSSNHFQSNMKPKNSSAFAGEAELFKSRKHLDEESSSSVKTEHQMMCSVMKKLAKGVKSERNVCKTIDKMNSNLLREIGEAELLATKFIAKLEKEEKAREKLDGVCYDLAREIEARKAEIAALRDQQRRIQSEVEEERRMLQLAEVQAQMKLADAKLILEDKYAELNGIIAHLGVVRQAFGLVDDATEAERRRWRRSGGDDQARCDAESKYIMGGSVLLKGPKAKA